MEHCTEGALRGFDAVSLEILWKRAISAVDEAATALRRTSFSTLVWEQRLKKAKSWLSMSSDVSISEIAYSVGFKSPAHFSRMFKRVYSVNPSDLRSLAAAPG